MLEYTALRLAGFILQIFFRFLPVITVGECHCILKMDHSQWTNLYNEEHSSTHLLIRDI